MGVDALKDDYTYKEHLTRCSENYCTYNENCD